MMLLIIACSPYIFMSKVEGVMLISLCDDRPRECKSVQCTTQKKRERKEERWGKGDKGDALQGKTNTQGCFVQVLRGSGVDGKRGFLVIGSLRR